MKLKNSKEIRVQINKFDSLREFIKYPLRYYLHKLIIESSKQRKTISVYSDYFDHIAHTINLDGLYEGDYLNVFF